MKVTPSNYKNIQFQPMNYGWKWSFKSDSFELIQRIRGGQIVAMKVAKSVCAALNRTGGKGIDGLGRFEIKKSTGY